MQAIHTQELGNQKKKWGIDFCMYGKRFLQFHAQEERAGGSRAVRLRYAPLTVIRLG